MPAAKTTNTSHDWLAVARSLAPLIEAEAASGEHNANTSPEIVEAFKRSGLYWIGFPKSMGGDDADIVTMLEVGEEIARADAATGWTFLVGMTGSLIMSICVEAEAANELFGGAEKSLACGFANGANGTARRIDGGYLVSQHRNPFGSGTLYADRIITSLRILDENGTPVLLPDGTPETRLAWVDKSEVSWLENWQVNGLSGSGSGDYEIAEHLLPERYVISFDPESKLAGPASNMGFWGISFMFHTAIALGTMKRAIEEVNGITKGKRRGSYVVDEYAPYLIDFATMDANYHSARAWAIQVYTDAWAEAVVGEVSELTNARLEQVSTHLTSLVGSVTATAAQWAGSDPIKRGSALGRAVRDARVEMNHVLVDRSTLAKVAPKLADAWN